MLGGGDTLRDNAIAARASMRSTMTRLLPETQFVDPSRDAVCDHLLRCSSYVLWPRS